MDFQFPHLHSCQHGSVHVYVCHGLRIPETYSWRVLSLFNEFWLSHRLPPSPPPTSPSPLYWVWNSNELPSGSQVKYNIITMSGLLKKLLSTAGVVGSHICSLFPGPLSRYYIFYTLTLDSTTNKKLVTLSFKK